MPGDLQPGRTTQRPADSHRHPRKALFYPAWIVAGPQSEALPCKLIEISTRDGCLAVESATEIADEFVLLLSRDGTEGRRCRVSWRSEAQLGFAILGRVKRTTAAQQIRKVDT